MEQWLLLQAEQGKRLMDGSDAGHESESVFHILQDMDFQLLAPFIVTNKR